MSWEIEKEKLFESTLEKWDMNNPSTENISTKKSFFDAGFDEALDLELPIKFAEFLPTTTYQPYFDIKQSLWVNRNGIQATTKQLYDFWLKNIYSNQ